MKQNTTCIWFCCIVFPLLFGACRARFYTPNRNPVPLFKKAGDLYLDASSNFMNKVDFTAGYAPFKGIGVYAGYNRANEKSESTTSSTGQPVQQYSRTYNGSMLNLGLGYFLNEEIDEVFRFEVFGDLGLGSFKNNISGTINGFFNGNYTRIGIMPNVGYNSPSKRLDVAYSLRFSQIRFNNLTVKDSAFWDYDIERYDRWRSMRMLEQAITVRMGGEKLKFQMQFAAYHTLDSDTQIEGTVLPLNFSLMFGIVLNTNILNKD